MTFRTSADTRQKFFGTAPTAAGKQTARASLTTRKPAKIFISSRKFGLALRRWRQLWPQRTFLARGRYTTKETPVLSGSETICTVTGEARTVWTVDAGGF